MVEPTAVEWRSDSSASPVRRPSLLAVTSELPWPLDTGGHIRTFHIVRALARRFRLRLVAAASADQTEAVEALRDHRIDVRPVIVGRRALWREALRAAAAAARLEPYVLYRRHAHRGVRSAIREEVAREVPDLLYLDHLDSLVFRGWAASAPVVVDLHNVYSILARRAASEQSRTWSRRYLEREARLLARMEHRAARVADRLTVVSQEEAGYFRSLGARAVEVVPNGVDLDAYRGLPTGRAGGSPTLLYVGAMSWGPNVAAAEFLATTVLAEIRRRSPGVRLRIVGRDPAPRVRALGRLPGVEVTGPVPDVVPHLAEAHALVVPLEAGGGTRLKILEAFAAGLPVVSTPIGCEGLGATPGEHLLVADRDRFASAVSALLSDPELGSMIARRARDLARRRFDWGVVCDGACDVVEALLRSRSASPRLG